MAWPNKGQTTATDRPDLLGQKPEPLDALATVKKKKSGQAAAIKMALMKKMMGGMK